MKHKDFVAKLFIPEDITSDDELKSYITKEWNEYQEAHCIQQDTDIVIQSSYNVVHSKNNPKYEGNRKERNAAAARASRAKKKEQVKTFSEGPWGLAVDICK